MKYSDKNISLKTNRNAYISNIGFPVDFIGQFDAYRSMFISIEKTQCLPSF